MKQLLFLFSIVFIFQGCNNSYEQMAIWKKPKNIILLIGDGMGLTQMSTAFYYQDKTPSFTRFKHIGLHQNRPTDAEITDSAAGATAFSTGYKSYNGSIGVDEDTVARETILEMASERGQATGVIATSSITHATPASFYAHVESRKLADKIAAQLSVAPVDFFAGGGIGFFAYRKDGKNYLDTLEAHIPGLADLVVHAELLTPADLESQFRVTGGHWHHTEFAVDQMLMMRPTYEAGQYATPLPGLYLCGAGSHPGGGLMGGPGHNAAHEILK